MNTFAICRKAESNVLSRLPLDFVAPNFPRTRPKEITPVTIHAANVRSADAHDGVFNGRATCILGPFYRFLNGRNSLVQINDYAFCARAARFGRRHGRDNAKPLSVTDHERAGFSRCPRQSPSKSFPAVFAILYPGPHDVFRVHFIAVYRLIKTPAQPPFPTCLTLGHGRAGLSAAAPAKFFSSLRTSPLQRRSLLAAEALQRFAVLLAFAVAFTVGFFGPPLSLSIELFRVNSNAGFGIVRSCGPMRVSNAAGFTPAAAAIRVAAGLKAAVFAVRSMSGFTMIWVVVAQIH